MTALLSEQVTDAPQQCDDTEYGQQQGHVDRPRFAQPLLCFLLLPHSFGNCSCWHAQGFICSKQILEVLVAKLSNTRHNTSGDSIEKLAMLYIRTSIRLHQSSDLLGPEFRQRYLCRFCNLVKDRCLRHARLAECQSQIGDYMRSRCFADQRPSSASPSYLKKQLLVAQLGECEGVEQHRVVHWLEVANLLEGKLSSQHEELFIDESALRHGPSGIRYLLRLEGTDLSLHLAGSGFEQLFLQEARSCECPQSHRQVHRLESAYTAPAVLR
mmetsp:Transcript_23692/g.55265  ORF Transcript_23692/g.55265 Transcript_23692/m.55265 type:complete len:270 (+) Transcript_23692:30-839(+)